MTSYYSTFATGLQEVVVSTLKEKLKDVRIDLILDGLVVYKSNEALEKILNIRFLNNTFVLIHSTDHKKVFSVRDLIEDFLHRRNLINELPRWTIKGKKSFRVIASEENQIVSVDKKVLEKLETLFKKVLRLKVNRAKPGVEIWFLKRREGYGFVGLRLTKTPNYEKILRKGELRPELANILCLLSEPSSSDVFLDPFAGSGTIPVERTTFPYREVIASDNDPKIYSELKNRIRKSNKKIRVENWDGFNLHAFKDSTVDKVVTDPPWGIYKREGFDLPNFYRRMAQELLRVLKKDGLLVLLTAQKEIFEEILGQFSQRLLLISKYDTLVSGKKAAIYKTKKI